MAALTRRVVARARTAKWKWRRRLTELRAPTRTALAITADRLPPPASAFARFGADSVITAPADIDGAANIELGDDVVLGEISHIRVAGDGRLIIGNRCRLGPAFVVDCGSRVEIGNNVTAASRVAVTDRDWHGAAPVMIEDDVRFGCGAIVGPGVRVGRGAIVADGAVVVDDVPAGAFVVGNPAVPAPR